MPGTLREALDREAALAGVGTRELGAAAARLSASYRRGERTASAVEGRAGVAAYLASRMPATFGATAEVFEHVAEVLGAFQPASVLDVGGGPGTAIWAAAQVWPTIARAAVVDRNPLMVEAGQRLAAGAPHPALAHASWITADVLGSWTAHRADLVVAAYVVGELGDQKRQHLLERLWDLAAGVLVLVEPGTPRGFSVVDRARRQLAARGAITAAPCPHDAACPLQAPDWCHFAARVPRSRLHRRLKGGDAPYEDEKFSYTALARTVPAARRARVIRHPLTEKGRVTLTVCGPEGVGSQSVPASSAAFRAARKTRWGSLWTDAGKRP